MDAQSKTPDRIQCPKCGEAIDLPALLRSQVEAGLKAQLEAAYAKKSSEQVERAKKEAKQLQERESREAEEKLRAKDQEIDAFRKRVGEAALKEAALLQKERDIEIREQASALAVQKGIAEQLPRIQEQAEKMARERAEIEASEARRLGEEAHRQKEAGLLRKIDELQQKVQQGSEQLQGESAEEVLKNDLAHAFPRDLIEDVAKGVTGADLVHQVRNEPGSACGTILWESKQTKAWEEKWLPKLRGEMRSAGAMAGVIVTRNLPPDVRHFGSRDGIWVCRLEHAVPLAAALRAGLIEVAEARRAAEGQSAKAELVYRYLTSEKFKLLVQGVVEALADMREGLEKEKKAMQAIWTKRATQLEMAQQNIIGFHSSLRGIAWSTIGEVAALELAPPEGMGSPAAAETPALPDETAPSAK